MANPTYDITLNQYATFKMSFQITDNSGSAVDITNWSFTGSIRDSFTLPDPPITTLNIVIVDYSSSMVNVGLLPTQSALLTKKKFVYDIIATNVGVAPVEVYRILEGKVNVNLGVTELDADH
jgi:hypothetical protein